MAYAGQILDKPLGGERIVFRKTASETGGELLVFELFLIPDGHVPGAHVHPEQEKRRGGAGLCAGGCASGFADGAAA